MQPSLTIRVRSGVMWSASSVLLKMGVELARSIALGRLLAPDDFGLFGMASATVGALNALTNAGLEMSLIVRDFSSDEELHAHLNTVWATELS